MRSDDVAPWLATMRELAGTAEYPGGQNNPVILGWAGFIAGRWPEMAAYAALYRSDDTAWCGLTVAYCFAKHGIRPPFGEKDTERFLWANSFPAWGIRLDAPRPGCIVVFKWENGRGHVGFLDRAHGSTLYVLGGNQSDAVNVTPFAWNRTVVGFFWPPEIAAQPATLRTPADVRMRMGKAITLAEARRDARGNLAVYYPPANDGGGAYEVAGINVRYHPNEAARLKALIEAGRFLEAEDFVGQFTAAYTDVADVWTSSWGVEFYLRDCVFNRGPTGAARILQRALMLRGESLAPDGVDGDVGPITMAAMRRQEGDVGAMLIALRQAREDYEREDVGYRANLWRGLINRFDKALSVARQFQAEQPKEPPVADDDTIKELQGMRADIAQLTAAVGALVSEMKGAAPVPPVVDPAPVPVPPTTPPATTPVLEKPGVGTGLAGLLLSALLQWKGGIDVTEAGSWGQLLPIVSAGLTGLGATGMFGGLGGVLSAGLSWLLKQTPTPKS